MQLKNILRPSVIALACIAYSASLVSGAPIVTGNGVYSGFTLSGNTATYDLGSFTQASPNQVAAQNVGGGLNIGLNPQYGVSDLGINLAGFSVNGGAVGLPGTFTITGQSNSGVDFNQTAVFNIVGAQGLLTDNLNMTGDVRATLQLVSDNLGGLDFGIPGSLYEFILSYQGRTFTAVLPAGPGTTSGGGTTASFTIAAIPFAPIIEPEPASLAVWGIILGAGFLARRRIIVR